MRVVRRVVGINCNVMFETCRIKPLKVMYRGKGAGKIHEKY